MSIETPETPADPQIAPVATPVPEASTGSGQGPTAYSLALAVLVSDQLSKLWFLSQGLLEGESRQVFGPFSLTMVWNRGVSFGLFRADVDWIRWALTFFSLAVAIVIAFWARKVQRPLLGWAFGLIMGGAVGNMIDRVRLGAVADFIDITPIGRAADFLHLTPHGFFPWVFNVADSAISVGVVLLLIDTFLADRKPKSG